MKKVQHILGMIVCCIIMLLSCSKSNDASSSALLPELVQAEEIMYESPDSALHILQTMPIPQPSDKLQYATWALFMTQAKYKLYMNQSDSLINIAYNYFIQQNSPQRKAMVHYYKAALYKESKNIEKAQEFYLKAIAEVEKTKDYQLAHLIYFGLSDLYVYRSLLEYALNCAQKASEYAIKGGNNKQIVFAYILKGRIYGKLEENEESVNNYKQAISYSIQTKEYELATTAMYELASKYCQIRDFNSALLYAKKSIDVCRSNSINVSEQLYLTMGIVYKHFNKLDSAKFYLNKALSGSPSIYTQRSGNILLSTIAKDEKQYKYAITHLEKAWGAHDSIQIYDKSKALIEMQEKYDQQKIINEKNELEIKKDKIIHRVLGILAVLICVIVIIIYRYKTTILEKERIIQEAEEKIRTKVMQLQENELIISRNQNRMEELNEQIKKNRNIQEYIDEQVKALTKIQEDNINLERENKILQEDIITISSALKEKSKEIIRLQALTEENLYLHEREKFLCQQLILKNDLFNKLKERPKYIEAYQWEELKENIDYLFNNFTRRLSKLIPFLTDSDLQICCLIKLHLSNQAIATLLAISPTSVSKRKQRLKERILQVVGSFKDSQTLDIWLWDF